MPKRRDVGGLLKLPRAVVAGLLIGAGLLPLPAAAAQVAVPSGGPIYEAIVLDAETGQVLRELNPDGVTYPASLTKLMTLYLTFEALNTGRLRLDQYFQVSYEAASRSPSKLGLTPGEPVMVRDLILGIVTKSANDAAAVLAEGLGGSEPAFAVTMTRKARQLGMDHTNYRNASGLPDPNQLTTARDIARLALALCHDFPREYRYFSVREFEFRGEIVPSHDHLLEWYEGADGLKTGFTVASGFNLATSAVRDGHRLIGVIMGGRSARSRDEEMAQLLDLGYADLARSAPPAVARREAPAAPVVAAAAPIQRVTPPPSPPQAAPPSFAAVAAASMAPPPPAAVEAPPARDRPPTLGAVASAAMRHLTPVASAEAASLPMRQADPAEAWGIQLGSFRGETEAEQVERKVAHLAFAKGKPAQILSPAPGERKGLYRPQLLHFSPHAAQAACDALHKKGIACSVVRPAGIKVASR